MSQVCPKCGLPKELCVCETISKETQKIKIIISRRKFGKEVTIVDGIDYKNVDINKIAKKLKGMLACGGTVKDGKIELQGNHKDKIKNALIKLGFSSEVIEL